LSSSTKSVTTRSVSVLSRMVMLFSTSGWLLRYQIAPVIDSAASIARTRFHARGRRGRRSRRQGGRTWVLPWIEVGGRDRPPLVCVAAGRAVRGRVAVSGCCSPLSRSGRRRCPDGDGAVVRRVDGGDVGVRLVGGWRPTRSAASRTASRALSGPTSVTATGTATSTHPGRHPGRRDPQAAVGVLLPGLAAGTPRPFL
jgi:hypothetical protein